MKRFFSALGQFDVRFRYIIVALWIVVTIVCVKTLPGIGSVAKNTESGFLPASSPSELASSLFDPFQQSNLAASTLVVSRGSGQLTPSDQAAVGRLFVKIRDTSKVVNVKELATSRDGHAMQILIQANVSPYGATDGVHLVDVIRGYFKQVHAPTGLQFNLTGQLPTAVDAAAAGTHSANLTQYFSVLFIIVLLFFAYRSLLAPLMTIIPAGIVLALSSPVIAAASHLGVQVSSITQLVLIVLVLGAGTDYGVFLVFRVREEIRNGLDARAAIIRAIETVGESITFSALIVIGALSTVVFAQFGFYQGLGPALAIGIALMLVAGLTLLPALLAIFGRAVFWPSPLTMLKKPKVGLWGRIASRVVRYPLLTTVIGVIVFGALAFGSVGIGQAGFQNQSSGPAGTDSARGEAVLSKYFPQTGATATSSAVAMKFTTSVWHTPTELVEAQTALEKTGKFNIVIGALDPNGPASPGLSVAETAHLYTVLGWPIKPATLTPAVVSQIPRAQLQLYTSLVQFISANGKTVQFAVIPKVGPPGSDAATGNIPALRSAITSAQHQSGAIDSGLLSIDGFAYDVQSVSGSDLLHIIPVVAIVIIILLAIVLRSLIAPFYLAASVVMSYLAALGLTAIVFVRIHGQSGIQFILPFMMFIFLMALGSDYNVLVMTRIREEAHRLPLKEAVQKAIGATGTTVTTAGLVLGGTFGVLGFSGSMDGGSAEQIEQIAFGIAAGIIVDTFIIRTIIIPAVVVLVGRMTWWPSKLVMEPTGVPNGENVAAPTPREHASV